MVSCRSVRHTEQHYETYGSATIKTVQLCLLVVWVLVVFIGSVNAIQSILFTEKVNMDLADTSKPNYKLNVEVDTGYVIDGDIGLAFPGFQTPD